MPAKQRRRKGSETAGEKTTALDRYLVIERRIAPFIEKPAKKSPTPTTVRWVVSKACF